MIKRKIVVPVFLLALPILAWAYSGGPPDQKTGAPGEGTCIDCHDTFPINSGNGAFTIAGPAYFDAGQTYEITIEISDQGQSRWGFEFTPLDQGDCAISDASHTQLSSAGGNSYVKHTSSGTYAGTPNGPISWTFDWTAPASPPDSVIFYAAGNAANNNNSTSNDYIYSTHFTTYRATGINDLTDNLLPSHFVVSNFPNPFNARTEINFSLPESGRARLAIYDVTGQLVRELVDEYLLTGVYSRQWDGLNSRNIPTASGIYFIKLAVGNYSTSHSMILLK